MPQQKLAFPSITVTLKLPFWIVAVIHFVLFCYTKYQCNAFEGE